MIPRASHLSLGHSNLGSAGYPYRGAAILTCAGAVPAIPDYRVQTAKEWPIGRPDRHPQLTAPIRPYTRRRRCPGDRRGNSSHSSGWNRNCYSLAIPDIERECSFGRLLPGRAGSTYLVRQPHSPPQWHCRSRQGAGCQTRRTQRPRLCPAHAYVDSRRQQDA